MSRALVPVLPCPDKQVSGLQEMIGKVLISYFSPAYAASKAAVDGITRLMAVSNTTASCPPCGNIRFEFAEPKYSLSSAVAESV